MKVSKHTHIRQTGPGAGLPRRNPPGKVPVKQVIIQWKEGGSEAQTYPKAFPSIKEADRQLLKNSLSAPPAGKGYHKHGVEVVWADGTKHDARLDVKHYGLPNNDILVGHHLKGYYEWILKARNNPMVKPKDRIQAKKMLNKYDMED